MIVNNEICLYQVMFVSMALAYIYLYLIIFNYLFSFLFIYFYLFLFIFIYFYLFLFIFVHFYCCISNRWYPKLWFSRPDLDLYSVVYRG